MTKRRALSIWRACLLLTVPFLDSFLRPYYRPPATSKKRGSQKHRSPKSVNFLATSIYILTERFPILRTPNSGILFTTCAWKNAWLPKRTMGNRALRRCYCLAGSLTSAQHRNCAGTPVVDRHNEHDLGVTFLQTTMNTSQEEDHLAFAGGGGVPKKRAHPNMATFAPRVCQPHVCPSLRNAESWGQHIQFATHLQRAAPQTLKHESFLHACGILFLHLKQSTFMSSRLDLCWWVKQEARRKTERAIWGLPQKEHTHTNL